ncbi:hypothetical protein EJ640_04420, partial [Pseudomonas aeruginosa]
ISSCLSTRRGTCSSSTTCAKSPAPSTCPRRASTGVRTCRAICGWWPDVLAPTLQALALLAGAVTLVHALGVWARS